MRFIMAIIFSLVVFSGCAQFCEFGKTTDASGLKCYRVFSKARVGMTGQEVEKRIGSPQKKNVEVSYRGKTYDEVWVYNTAPPTILYFKNGLLEHKEYQQ